MTRALIVALSIASVALGASVAAAQDADASDEAIQAGPHARVIVDRTPLRSGPGHNHRAVGVARRDQVFPIRRRASQGYWFQVERPDGTLAWILGDATYVLEIGGDDATGGRPLPRLLGPPPLLETKFEISAMFGVIERGGFMAVRPTWMIRPEFGVELSFGVGVSRAGRLFVLGGGGVVNLFPRSPVVPFLVVGGGVAITDPNADTFLLESGQAAALYGGGGIRIALKYRLTLRIEARAYAFFEPDRYVQSEEISGGLSVFF